MFIFKTFGNKKPLTRSVAPREENVIHVPYSPSVSMTKVKQQTSELGKNRHNARKRRHDSCLEWDHLDIYPFTDESIFYFN
jgi:hypothetical protein